MTPLRSVNGAPWRFVWAGWAALSAVGCALPTSPTMSTVPPALRRAHPWGPEINAARDLGEIPSIHTSRKTAKWAAFGREHIRDGDILFRYGKEYDPRDVFLSYFLTSVCDSRFSHDAIAHWEGDRLFMYDSEPMQGVRKVPFELWNMDVFDHSLVIKRLKPEYQGYIPAAIAFCEDAYLREVPYDEGLKIDDEALYCSELVEKAFLSAGLPLSQPVPIRCLPHYLRWSPMRPIVERFTAVRADEPVYAPGNEHFGSFGSPYLETVYDRGGPFQRRPRKPPTNAAPPPDLVVPKS
jgi:hypothetical protein